jgi:hypothetical protein
MPNMFISLDVPRGEGVGLPAIVSNTGHPKSFVLGGTIPGGRYVVEGSNDGGRSWDILIDDDGTEALFVSNNGGAKSVDCIIQQVRVRSIRNPADATPPSITMGAPPALGTNFFSSISVPALQGLGDPLDLGLRVGPLKTFTMRGSNVAGARFSVLASMDGIQFDEIIQFTADQQGARSRQVMCRYLRVLRGGALGGDPVIAVGGEPVQEASGGSALPSSELSIASDRAFAVTASEGEEVLAEYVAPLSALAAATLTPDFAGAARGGPCSHFRVRIGGTMGTPDGTELAAFDAPDVESPRAAQGAPFDRPNAGSSLIKITGQGNGAVLRGFDLLFHGA